MLTGNLSGTVGDSGSHSGNGARCHFEGLRSTQQYDRYTLLLDLPGDELIQLIGASVCILETYSNKVPNKVRGLARMVQVSPTLTLVDLTVRGLSPGKYWATIRETGNVSEGPASTGGIWEGLKSKLMGSSQPRGVLGAVQVGQNGVGNVFLDRPVQIWEIIGRSLVVTKQLEGQLKKDDPDTLVGVIARSAGVWENEKTVCSCSGKTLWEERKENANKGML